MTKWKLKLATFLAVILSSMTGAAQAQSGTVPSSELVFVKNGVFSLKVGESKDLTDRAMLLTLRQIYGLDTDVPGPIDFSINGGTVQAPPGFRLDLKQRNETKDFIKDLGVCVLDVVKIFAAKGAVPTVTFRLLCK